MKNEKKRLAIIGAGFWSHYQIAAWKELQRTILVAVCDRDRSKAESLANKFGIPSVYVNAEEMIRQKEPDVVDIITNPETHEELVLLAAREHTPVICQKPMATTIESASRMVEAAKKADIPFFVHENWRWQRPLREIKNILNQDIIGKIFRGRIIYSNNFPVFINQPFLKELDRFILTDMGTHLLDVSRFLFGEAETVYCQTASVSPEIKGEDVATVQLKMKNGVHVGVDMSYASVLEEDTFPQTLVLIEGEKGSIRLGPDYWVTTTIKQKSQRKQYSPKSYHWIDPAYVLVQSSIVDANQSFLEGLEGKKSAETTGEDNLKTLKLVYAAYESADTNIVIAV